MAIKEAKTAIRRHLSLLSPQLPTALEGISFVPPAGMYQRLQFLINPPTDPVFGRYFHRENIQIQLFVSDKVDTGDSAAIERAELLRDWFHKGLTLNEGGFRMHILRTPQIAGTAVVGDRVIVPVLIPLMVEVYE
jgi:hypothetical protein